MDKPSLLVISGCNGSGKSSFSKALSQKGIIPFDYDKKFLEIYESIRDSELRTLMAHNMTRVFLEKEIDNAIANKSNFCYETNFNSTPMFWPDHFQKKGYEINMVFFCLDSIQKAKKRVQIRVENGGHFVPEKEVEKRYFDGYKNLNTHFDKFNNLHLLNSSFYNEIPKHILSLNNGSLVAKSIIPDFLKDLTPNLINIKVSL